MFGLTGLTGLAAGLTGSFASNESMESMAASRCGFWKARKARNFGCPNAAEFQPSAKRSKGLFLATKSSNKDLS